MDYVLKFTLIFTDAKIILCADFVRFPDQAFVSRLLSQRAVVGYFFLLARTVRVAALCEVTKEI